MTTESSLLKTVFDNDGDGNPDRIETNTYDANGNLTSFVIDYYGDDTPDKVYTYINIYDENNNLISKSIDNETDGHIDIINTC
jgi:hypothetical protein